MWGFLTQPGLATAVMDFTHALSPLGMSLFGLVALSAGMLACTALRHNLSQAARPVTETAPSPAEYRQAA